MLSILGHDDVVWGRFDADQCIAAAVAILAVEGGPERRVEQIIQSFDSTNGLLVSSRSGKALQRLSDCFDLGLRGSCERLEFARRGLAAFVVG